ncbi:M56 family metallopeptidase [uncultured Pseudokineococcus sp.]|uniref:M56 family metallopeptidase n=1 Tax=uncultured Pseudokineococcus sp. TaxID=1642928 RepID=UPI002620AFC7|nr:M56 family metallopeptidase [uncultured Pseudokineococcus sp.]
MTTLLLGGLGLGLSLLVPEVLARARWTARAPGPSVVLWQAVTLASVLSAVGVVLVAPEELVRALDTGPDVEAWVLVGALAVAGLIVARLVWSTAGVLLRSQRRRARHADLVDLLGRAETGALQHPGGAPLRVLDGPLPLAYCLPGRAPRVVLSGAALQALTAEQVQAVLTHEQAHLRARHDLVLESFTAVYQAVPRPLRSRVPLESVSLLLEMVADDAARARCGPAPLASALCAMSTDGDLSTHNLSTHDLGPAGRAARRHDRTPQDDRRRRVGRLQRPATAEGSLRASVLALAVAVLVLPTAFVVAPWLAQALASLPPLPGW